MAEEGRVALSAAALNCAQRNADILFLIIKIAVISACLRNVFLPRTSPVVFAPMMANARMAGSAS